MKCIFFLLLTFSIIHTHADAIDSVFTYQKFIHIVLSHHPISKQADLRLQIGEAEVLNAKGNFDPSIFSDWSQKNFDKKLYYKQYSTQLRIPTNIGLDVLGGYENTGGDFLNPENKTNPNGLWHLGVELDVLQGLFTNERNVALKQANIYQDLTKNEQTTLLNELVYNASYAYLQWQLFHHFEKIFIENQKLAQTYFSNTKASYQGGEKSAMDTLEAFILFQDATIELQKNSMMLIASKLQIDNYLWFENEPVFINENALPEAYQNEMFMINEFLNDSISLMSNPSILISLNKLSILEIEQKLKREKLKPKLKLKYNPLLSTSPNSISPNYSIENYNWGFVFSMPLFFRSARADMQQGKIKITELDLDIENKKNELSNKIKNTWRQQSILQDQQTLLSLNSENYRILLEGENEKFKYGESSVFLLNKRQEKYISTKLKLIENQMKLHLEKLKYLYYSNQLVKN